MEQRTLDGGPRRGRGLGGLALVTVPTPGACRTAADVESLATRMYGEAALGAPAGVVHVTALWRAPDGVRRTIRIGEHSPPSEYDAFALNLTRARADAIVVTGKVLRDEPTLRYQLQGPGSLPSALDRWRREVAERSEPPWLLVLTRGHGLDLSHPALHGWARPLVYTTREAKRRIEKFSAASGVEVVADALPTVGGALRHLWTREVRTCVLEAGLATTRELYDAPGQVDELVRSTFEGPLPPPAQGAALVSDATLDGMFPHRSVPFSIDGPSGPWTFDRLSRG